VIVGGGASLWVCSERSDEMLATPPVPVDTRRRHAGRVAKLAPALPLSWRLLGFVVAEFT
jgi:hypothetical protein